MKKPIMKRILAAILAATLSAGIVMSGAFSATAMAKTAEAPSTTAIKAAFDADFYANQYPDIKAAYGTDKAGMLNHFLTFGMKEGRMMNADFDPKAYCDSYPDIKAICPANDYTNAYVHYVTYGIKEGRTNTTYAKIRQKQVAAQAAAAAAAAAARYDVYLGHDLTVNISASMYESSTFIIMKDKHDGYGAYYGNDLYDTSRGYNAEGAYHYSTIRIENGNTHESMESRSESSSSSNSSSKKSSSSKSSSEELTDDEAEALAYLIVIAALKDQLDKGEISQEDYDAAINELMNS